MLRYAIPVMVLAAAVSAGAATPQNPASQSPAEARQEAALAKRLEGLTPGKAVTCLSPRAVTQVKIYNDTAVYVASRDRVWVNKTNGRCGRNDDDIIVSRTNGQYCRGDILETRDRAGGFFSGSCALGDFVPYTRAK